MAPSPDSPLDCPTPRAVCNQGRPRLAHRPVPPSPTCLQASDAIGVLMAYSAKVRIDQIGSNDTTDTLTNGVSSRRNQLLMDISSELGVASVDGAAEATLDKLAQIVNKAAPNYKPFGAVLSEALRDRLRSLFGAAGVKQQYIRDRVTNVWQLGEGWVASVLAALLLDTREGASSRGGDLAKLPTAAVQNKPEADKLIDAAVEVVAQLKGVAVALPSAGGAAGGAVSIPPRSTPSPRRSPVPTACSPPPPASC